MLGVELRKRYIINEGLLSPTFNRSEIHVYSTDINRTEMSAESQLMGLYPAGTGYELPNDLRDKAVPPVHVTNLDSIQNELGPAALPNQDSIIGIHSCLN